MRSDALDGTRWALEYLTLGEVSHLVNGRRIPEIAFVDGRVSCDDGVNLAEGTYSLEGESLTLSLEPSTRIPYPHEPLVEHDLFEYLGAVRSYVVHGDFLHLRHGEGADELVYHYEEDGAPA